MDLWDNIYRNCGPWRRFCMSLITREFFERYAPPHIQLDKGFMDRAHSSANVLLPTDQFSEDSTETMWWDEIESTSGALGNVRGCGITMVFVEEYSCKFVCVNDDGPDNELLDRLKLIDDYWRDKMPGALKYKSFFEDNNVINGKLSPDNYTLDELCQTDEQRRQCNNGILEAYNGDVASISTRSRGYQWIVLDISASIEDATFSLKVLVDNCINCD